MRWEDAETERAEDPIPENEAAVALLWDERGEAGACPRMQPCISEEEAEQSMATDTE